MFAFVAVVALFDTLPAVEMVANLVSAIAALALMSAFTIAPAAMAVVSATFPLPLNDTAVAVTSPVSEKSLAFCSVVAVDALPVTAPVSGPLKPVDELTNPYSVVAVVSVVPNITVLLPPLVMSLPMTIALVSLLDRPRVPDPM